MSWPPSASLTKAALCGALWILNEAILMVVVAGLDATPCSSAGVTVLSLSSSLSVSAFAFNSHVGLRCLLFAWRSRWLLVLAS